MAFIVFEGLDGSGKSTLIKGLSEELQAQKIPYMVTREPGGTSLGEEIRRLLLRTAGEPPSKRAELLLYEADRAHHVDTQIQPHLSRGAWVLCDRFTASSLAFQAGGRGLDEQQIAWLNNYATGGLEPELTVLLDLPVEDSFRRIQKRGNETGQERDRFEKEEKAFHERVREYYLRLARGDASRWLVLDAKQPVESLLALFLDELMERQWLKS